MRVVEKRLLRWQGSRKPIVRLPENIKCTWTLATIDKKLRLERQIQDATIACSDA